MNKVAKALNKSFGKKNINEIGIHSTIGLLIAIGSFLRLYKLGKDSFWFDEIDQITTAALPFSSLFEGLTWHVSPPLDYIILHFVLSLGRDETLVRLPAALFGIAAIYVLYRAGHILHSVEIGLGAATLLTFSLAAIAYAQEGRMYSLFIFLTSLLLWRCAVLSKNPNSWQQWLITSVVAVFLIYTHYYAVLILFGLGLLWLALSFWPRLPWQARQPQNRALFVRGLLSFSLVGTLFAFWLPTLLVQSARRSGTLSYALAREDYWETLVYYLSGGLRLPFAIFYLLLFAVGFIYCLRQRSLIAGLLMAFTVIPALLAYVVPAISQTVTPRNMLCLLPGYLLGIALGFRFLVEQSLSQLARWQRVAWLQPFLSLFILWLTVVGIAVLALAPSYSMLRQFHDVGWWMKNARTNWRQTADLLMNSMQPGDVILVNNSRARYLLSFYLDPAVISGQTISDFVRQSENHTLAASRYIPILTMTTSVPMLRERLSVASGSFLLSPKPEALQAVGIDPAQLQTVETFHNISLSYSPREALSNHFTVSLDHIGSVFATGWSDDLYQVENKPVRWMSSKSSLSLPVWSAENDHFLLSFFAPSDLSGAELQLSFEDKPATSLLINGGWQSITVPIPASLLAEADSLAVQLELTNLPPPPDSYPIGSTGMKSPVLMMAESSGQPGDIFARLHVNADLYDWDSETKRLGRGYNLLALEPINGTLLDLQVFDTHGDVNENDRMLAWVEKLPGSTIVIGAVADEGSASLNDKAIFALQQLGSEIDLRGYYRRGHAFIGVKGALAGTALERAFNYKEMVMVASDRLDFMLAISEIVLQPNKE